MNGDTLHGRLVAALAADYARGCGRPDDTGLRLLAVINGWPVQEGPAPALTWATEAVRTRLQP